MTVERPTYMLSPNWDILAAPDGPLTLGAIMANAKDPLRELNKGSRIPLADTEITTTHKKPWSFARSNSRSGSVGFWTSLVSIFTGVEADTSIEASRSGLRSFSCTDLETRYFQPGFAYIAKALKAPFVSTFLSNNGWWNPKPLYMVTGVKIARGAQVEAGKGGSLAWKVKLGVDGTAVGAPVSLGPEASYKTEDELKETFTAMDDFVVAYRLIRIKAKSKTADDFREEDYNKWALFSDEEIVNDAQIEEDLKRDFEIEYLSHAQSDSSFENTPTVVLKLDEDDAELVLPADAFKPFQEKH